MAATEPPSVRRLREAREQGRTPRSELLAPSCLLLALALWLFARGETLWAALEQRLTTALRLEAPFARASASAFEALRGAVVETLLVLGAAFALSALLQLVQVGFVFARRAPAGPVRPLLAGFSSGALSSAVLLAGVVVGFCDALDIDWLAPSVSASPASALRGFAWTVLLGSALVVAIDVVRSRQAFVEGLRLTRHEAERERRQEQGSDHVRRRRRALSRERRP